MRRKRNPLEVGASLSVSNEQGTSCSFTQLRPQHPALAVHLTSAELGDREGSVALLLPSHRGTGEWGADQNDGVPSPFALTTCIELQPDTISHFQKQKAL